ncbi:unnamed protein product, partial [Adineta ricciae]
MTSPTSSSNMNSTLQCAIKIEQLNSYVLDFSSENISFTKALADGINLQAEQYYLKRSKASVNIRHAEINAKGFGPTSLLVKMFAQIVHDDKKSEECLKENPDLMTEQNLKTLLDWCLSEEIDNNFSSMENTLNQATIMKSILYLINTTKNERIQCIELFFFRLSSSPFHKNDFEREYKILHEKIRSRALEISQKFSDEDEEEKRLIEQGYAQNLILKSLPKDLKHAVTTRDLQRFKSVLMQMPEDE